MFQCRSNRLLPVLLLALLILPDSFCFGQTLKAKLAERTTFVPRSDTPLNQLIEVARKFIIPMGIEWVEEIDELPNNSLDFHEGRVIDLIAAITKSVPDAVVNEEGEALHVFFLHAVFSPMNFLNLRIPEYHVFNEELYIAEGLLGTRINMELYPEMYSGGFGGGYGGGIPNPFMGRNINFSGYDLTIREILTRIAQALGNALWMVKLSPDELTGERPKWEGVPRDESGHSPINYRWRFIPLDE
jgi:hypothetical protein